MNDDRIGHLEQRVAIVEHDVGEIKAGLVQIHSDLKDNTRVTQLVADNTRDIVKTSAGISFLFTLIAKITAVAGGVAGVIYLAQLLAGVLHP